MPTSDSWRCSLFRLRTTGLLRFCSCDDRLLRVHLARDSGEMHWRPLSTISIATLIWLIRFGGIVSRLSRLICSRRSKVERRQCSTGVKPYENRQPVNLMPFVEYIIAIIAQHFVDPEKWEHAFSIFQDLTEPELLRRCSKGYRQNVKESFNSLIWLRCPKTVYRSIDSIRVGMFDAVICTNCKYSGGFTVLDELGLNTAIKP